MPTNKLIFALPVLIALAIAASGARSGEPAQAAPPALAPRLPGHTLAPLPSETRRALLLEEGTAPLLVPRECPHAGVAGLDAVTDDDAPWPEGYAAEPAWHRDARRAAGLAAPCRRPPPGSLHGPI